MPVWAVYAHISTTPRVGPDERSKLGVMSPLAALAGLAWTWLLPAAFGDSSFGVLVAPFGPSIAAGPAAAFLYERDHHLRALFLVGFPILGGATCGMMA